jgi:hypothetical protein
VKTLDPLAKGFLAACLIFTLVGVTLKLNGSSTALWKDLLHDSASKSGLILSTAKIVRSDEWLVWTPAVAGQAERGFPTTNLSIGSGKAPLLYNLPARDYTMFFRPQLWGFFLFNFERGYAWYWNVKVFGLLASFFLLLRLLTGSSRLSLFGSFWLFLSNYTQWWFSCPPMLPEMLSCWALSLVSAVAVLRTNRWWVRIAAAVAFVFTTVNFILCLYPPFQIPLIYVGLAILIGFFAERRRSGSPPGGRSGAICLLAAGIATGALLVPFFIECYPTLQTVAATSYPGLRRSHGGELSWLYLFSGVVSFFHSPAAFPEHFVQPIDAANFVPLWIPVLACVWPLLIKNPRQNAVSVALLISILWMSLYALCPLPQWFCRATFLSYCTGIRLLLPVGVANILFVTVLFPRLKNRAAVLSRRELIALIGCLAALTLLYLWRSAVAKPAFIPVIGVIFFFALDVAVILALLKAPARAFAIGFIALLLLTNGRVNPVMIGLSELTKSSPGEAIRPIIQADPAAGWLAYDSNPNSEFLMALGANVVSGVRTVPDLGFYKALDPSGQLLSVYNRYSFAYFVPVADRNHAEIRDWGFPDHFVRIHPENPALRVRDVRYFLFVHPVPNAAGQGLNLVKALPQNQMWIYGLAHENP